MKKSIDFRTTATTVETELQDLAEKTTKGPKLDWIKQSIKVNAYGNLTKVDFEDGQVKLYEKDRGLYSGFFVAKSGQVIEKYDDVTPEILCKYLNIQDLGIMPTIEENTPEVIAESDYKESGKYIKLKYGDLELEIKKSINDFVQDKREVLKK